MDNSERELIISENVDYYIRRPKGKTLIISENGPDYWVDTHTLIHDTDGD